MAQGAPLSLADILAKALHVAVHLAPPPRAFDGAVPPHGPRWAPLDSLWPESTVAIICQHQKCATTLTVLNRG